MANTIDKAYIDTFERNVRHLAQQSSTKLRPWVTERSSGGDNHMWDRLGKATAALKSGVRVATPTSDLAWSRRVSLAKTYHVGETVEPNDLVQMLIDPKSNVNQALGNAMRRQYDDSIIAAATGTALDSGGVNNAFPAGQIVSDYSKPISFDIVTEVQEKFMSNDIDPDEPKVFVVGVKMVRKLMQLTEQTSMDYVRRSLDQLSSTGIVPNWMGFTWIVSTRLNAPQAGQLDCFAMTRRALGLQVNMDITGKVAEDPSISFAWRIYAMMTHGVVRVEDEHIVWFKAKDAMS